MARYDRKDYGFERAIFQSKKYLSNAKETIFEEISNHYTNTEESYRRKLKKFDEVFDMANEISIKRRDNPATAGELRDDLIREYYYYKDSFLKKFLNKYVQEKPSFKRQYEYARKLTTIARLKNFINLYGKEKIIIQEKKGFVLEEKEITINTLVKKYKSGKISKQYLYDRINFFKEKNLAYYNTKEYRQNDINAMISQYAER